ncbi:hypothetical protein T484DRAFT_2408112 [Baffinella frigidus]|nr:hypothetical protein T484DRAFT_2408112 [Cryptophyta sp. CCMP2293]
MGRAQQVEAGAILEKAMEEGEQAYLADLQILPGKDEFSYLPINTQAVVVQPLGDGRALVLGGNKDCLAAPQWQQGTAVHGARPDHDPSPRVLPRPDPPGNLAHNLSTRYATRHVPPRISGEARDELLTFGACFVPEAPLGP